MPKSPRAFRSRSRHPEAAHLFLESLTPTLHLLPTRNRRSAVRSGGVLHLIYRRRRGITKAQRASNLVLHNSCQLHSCNTAKVLTRRSTAGRRGATRSIERENDGISDTFRRRGDWPLPRVDPGYWLDIAARRRGDDFNSVASLVHRSTRVANLVRRLASADSEADGRVHSKKQVPGRPTR